MEGIIRKEKEEKSGKLLRLARAEAEAREDDTSGGERSYLRSYEFANRSTKRLISRNKKS